MQNILDEAFAQSATLWNDYKLYVLLLIGVLLAVNIIESLLTRRKNPPEN